MVLMRVCSVTYVGSITEPVSQTHMIIYDITHTGGAARHSGGSIYTYPGLHTMHNPVEVERFESDLKRYLTRKIGLEAVMRVRCTKGLCRILAVNSEKKTFTDRIALHCIASMLQLCYFV